MRFIAFIFLFLLAAPVWAAEAPEVTGDPGTAGAAAIEQPAPAPVSVVEPEPPVSVTEAEPPIQPHEVPAVPAKILAPTDTATIPEGLRYILATPDDTTRGYQKLVQALAETPHGFRSLMPTDGEATTYAGVFIALHGMAGQEEKTKLFNTVVYKIPFSDLVTTEVNGYGAKTPQQLEMLAAAYMETVKIAPGYKIRKLTPPEMKVLWYSSARDINEPVFVVESGEHRYVFDLNPAGEYLEFFEDLGQPCFPETGTGEAQMPCKCVDTTSDGNKYTVVFQGCKTKE